MQPPRLGLAFFVLDAAPARWKIPAGWACRSGAQTRNAKTNGIEGVQLLSVYLLPGILFFYLPEAHVAH